MVCSDYSCCDFISKGSNTSQHFYSILNVTKDNFFLLLPKIEEFILQNIIPNLICELCTKLSSLSCKEIGILKLIAVHIQKRMMQKTQHALKQTVGLNLLIKGKRKNHLFIIGIETEQEFW